MIRGLRFAVLLFALTANAHHIVVTLVRWWLARRGRRDWQSHLEDDDSAREIFVDREIASWAGARSRPIKL